VTALWREYRRYRIRQLARDQPTLHAPWPSSASRPASASDP